MANLIAQENKTELLQKHEFNHGCSLVNYHLTNYDGKKTINVNADIIVDGVKVPKEVIKPGPTEVIERKHIAFGNRFHRSFTTLFKSYGVPFRGQYLVPDSCLPQLERESLILKEAYETEVENFVSKYPAFVQQKAEKHSDKVLRQIVYKAELSEHELRKKFRCDIEPPIQFAAKRPQDVQVVKSAIGAAIVEDVVKSAKHLYEESLKGREECTQKALRPLMRLKDRLYGLKLQHREASSVCDYIEKLTASLPKAGKLMGGDFNTFYRAVAFLKSKEELKAHIELQEAKTEQQLLPEPVSNEALSSFVQTDDGEYAPVNAESKQEVSQLLNSLFDEIEEETPETAENAPAVIDDEPAQETPSVSSADKAAVESKAQSQFMFGGVGF